MERRALLLVVAAIILGLTLYVVRHRNAPRAHNISWGTYNKIQEGMTEEQVTALLGVPPGDYSKSIAAVRGGRYGLLVGFRQEEWWSDTGVIRVYFNPDGAVAGKHFMDVEVKDKTWFGSLLEMLGL
jgi:hypothetical protein